MASVLDFQIKLLHIRDNLINKSNKVITPLVEEDEVYQMTCIPGESSELEM